VGRRGGRQEVVEVVEVGGESGGESKARKQAGEREEGAMKRRRG